MGTDKRRGPESAEWMQERQEDRNIEANQQVGTDEEGELDFRALCLQEGWLNEGDESIEETAGDDGGRLQRTVEVEGRAAEDPSDGMDREGTTVAVGATVSVSDEGINKSGYESQKIIQGAIPDSLPQDHRVNIGIAVGMDSIVSTIDYQPIVVRSVESVERDIVGSFENEMDTVKLLDTTGKSLMMTEASTKIDVAAGKGPESVSDPEDRVKAGRDVDTADEATKYAKVSKPDWVADFAHVKSVGEVDLCSGPKSQVGEAGEPGSTEIRSSQENMKFVPAEWSSIQSRGMYPESGQLGFGYVEMEGTLEVNIVVEDDAEAGLAENYLRRMKEERIEMDRKREMGFKRVGMTLPRTSKIVTTTALREGVPEQFHNGHMEDGLGSLEVDIGEASSRHKPAGMAKHDEHEITSHVEERKLEASEVSASQTGGHQFGTIAVTVAGDSENADMSGHYGNEELEIIGLSLLKEHPGRDVNDEDEMKRMVGEGNATVMEAGTAHSDENKWEATAILTEGRQTGLENRPLESGPGSLSINNGGNSLGEQSAGRGVNKEGKMDSSVSKDVGGLDEASSTGINTASMEVHAVLADQELSGVDHGKIDSGLWSSEITTGNLSLMKGRGGKGEVEMDVYLGEVAVEGKEVGMAPVNMVSVASIPRVEHAGKGETRAEDDSMGDGEIREYVIEGEDEDEEDDADFNPYLQRLPFGEALSAASSEAEEEGEEVEDQEDLAVADVGLDKGGEDLEGVEFEDDDGFLELQSDIDEDEFVDDEEDEEEEDEEEEEEEVVTEGEGGQVGSYQHGWNDEVDLGEMVTEAMTEGQGLDGGLGAVWSQDCNNEGLDRRERERISCIFGYGANLQERVEEELMMGHALEGLPELRSPRSERPSTENAQPSGKEERGLVADAISKRTRAHYSLADMSLDQLETFLQESDEEDYFQNVNDEEEYRKFLAAVQEKIEMGNSESKQEDAVEEEEESEDEDADFEVELEEALESDVDEGTDGEGRKRKRARKPETREKRRQRAKLQNKVRLLGLAKTPLRPLLPYVGDLPAIASVGERSKMMADRAGKVGPSSAKRQPAVNGFTAHQIGQLYCLIHEHVQLLVQVFALCILDPARQQEAIDTHRMLMELAEQRDSVLSWKKTAFPEFCFQMPYIHPSATENEGLPLPIESLANAAPGVSSVPANNASHFPSLLLGPGLSEQLVVDGKATFLPNSSFPESLLLGSPSRSMLPPSSSLLRRTPPGQTSQILSTSQSPGVAPIPSSLLPLPQASSSQGPNFFSKSTAEELCPLKCGHEQECASSRDGGAAPFDSLQTVGCSNVIPMCMASRSKTSCSDAVLNTPAHLFSSFPQTKSKEAIPFIAPNPVVLPPSSFISATPVSEWVPVTSGPVRSLLDVAPLALVREFLGDISQVVQDYRQQHVENRVYHTQCERDQLFAVQMQSVPSVKKMTGHLQQGNIGQGGLTSSLPSQPYVKKTMAAALVESTKKQSIAPVPKDVARAAKRFQPLFNKALFPHRAPPASTANRLLFTDAEDELLAMGLMTYNTDWNAIQQRFLPSKSTHQIFVRQKNRSSARAPENSIKSVRRMKASSLTTEEKACIQEGLTYHKYDWAKVWQFCVPHRDPTTLPRQWRIALGTQKSYKSNEINKEKRRLYEAGRRQAMIARMDGSLDIEEETGPSSFLDMAKERGEDCSADEDEDVSEEAYIRDAFLADWNPQSAISSLSAGIPPIVAAGIPTMSESYTPVGTVSPVSKRKRLTVNAPQPTVPASIPCVPMDLLSPYMPPCYVPSRRCSTKQTIKLAPGLPSLKLPPSVRVLSQSKAEDLQAFALLSNKIASGLQGCMAVPSWVLPRGQDEVGIRKAPATLFAPPFQGVTSTAPLQVTSSWKVSPPVSARVQEGGVLPTSGKRKRVQQPAPTDPPRKRMQEDKGQNQPLMISNQAMFPTSQAAMLKKIAHNQPVSPVSSSGRVIVTSFVAEAWVRCCLEASCFFSSHPTPALKIQCNLRRNKHNNSIPSLGDQRVGGGHLHL